MGFGAFFLLGSGALLLDRTGIIPLGARALLVGALFLVAALRETHGAPAGKAANQLGSRDRKRTSRLSEDTRRWALAGGAVAVSMALAFTVARYPIALAFGLWLAASLLIHCRSRLGSSVTTAAALLWPVLFFAETAQGGARLGALAAPFLDLLDAVAPLWNGSSTLLQVFPQAFLVLSVALVVLTAGRERRWPSLAIHLVLVLALNVLALRYWHEMVASMSSNWDIQVWPTSIALLLLLAHATLATIALAAISEMGETARPVESSPQASVPRRWRWAALASALIVGGTLGAVLAHGAYSVRLEPERLQGVNVLILDEGQLEHKSPTHDVLGMYSDGMFGTIDDYLRSFGAEPQFGTLSPESLQWADVVFIINPPRIFEPPELQALQSFLRDGGGLLCAGDHTCTEAIRDPINAITAEFGIRLVCDSAVAFQRHWLDAMRFLAHPVNHGFSKQEHAQVWIGASLEVEGPHAVPLLVGNNTFSDAPNFEVAGYLGDLSYNIGERMGDIVVAAGAEPPSGGRLFVFGDTSMLQNTAASTSWMYLQRVLLWLSGGAQESWARSLVPFALALLGLAGALLVVVKLRPPSSERFRAWDVIGRDRRVSIAPILLLGAVTGLFATYQSFATPEAAARIESPQPTLAVIDRAHGNRVLPLTWGPDAVHGLEMSFTREGLTPVTTQHWTESLLRSSRALAVIAPTHDIDKREARLLRRYLNDGGTLLLSISPDGAKACPRLCATVGVEVDATPLARPAALTRFGRITMYDAHPIRSTDGEAEIVAQSPSGDPVLIWKRFGRGGVLATGDPGLWVNKNLEDKDAWQTHNVHALWEMLRTYCAKGDLS